MQIARNACALQGTHALLYHAEKTTHPLLHDSRNHIVWHAGLRKLIRTKKNVTCHVTNSSMSIPPGKIVAC